MDIAFAGTSALEIIRQVRRNPRLTLVRTELPSPNSFRGPYGCVQQMNYSALGLGAPPTSSRPAYLRVPSKAERKRSKHIRCLVFPKTMPEHSILQLERTTAVPSRGMPATTARGLRERESLGGYEPLGKQNLIAERELFDGHRVFVDSAPLACATIAAQYQRLVREDKLLEADAVVRLIELVMELTGHYSRDPTDPRNGSALENVPGFSTIGEFQLFIEQSRHVPGVGLLSKALQYARNGSRSVMETAAWITLTLPKQYGCYGFANAKLNVAVVPSESQRALMQHRTLTPDILWERERVALEYQGFEEHASRAARTEDNRRANDYQVCGIIALFVTFDDLRTVAACDRLARKIARLMASHGARGEVHRIENLLADGATRQQRARLLANLLPPVNR